MRIWLSDKEMTHILERANIITKDSDVIRVWRTTTGNVGIETKLKEEQTNGQKERT